MLNSNKETLFLRSLLLLSLGILPLLMSKPPRKDWVIAYAYNAITNIILDSILVKVKLVTYPIRLLPKYFKIHILFDLVLYPTATVIFNQMTSKNRLPAILLKLQLFTIPLTLIEYWANCRTNLIKWQNGWDWYHSFIGVNLKSLVTRGVVQLFRVVAHKERHS